jgi:hypothetical protein
VTLHPAYDDASIEFDEGLVGTWRSEDEDATVRIERAEWRSYRIALETPRYSTTLSAHLTRIGDAPLLDVMPETGVDLSTLTIAVHGLFRIARDGDALSVTPLDYEAARRALPGGLGIPAVLDERQNVVITGATSDLRRWLAPHGRGQSFFGAGSVLRRVQAG